MIPLSLPWKDAAKKVLWPSDSASSPLPNRIQLIFIAYLWTEQGNKKERHPQNKYAPFLTKNETKCRSFISSINPFQRENFVIRRWEIFSSFSHLYDLYLSYIRKRNETTKKEILSLNKYTIFMSSSKTSDRRHFTKIKWRFTS